MEKKTKCKYFVCHFFLSEGIDNTRASKGASGVTLRFYHDVVLKSCRHNI